MTAETHEPAYGIGAVARLTGIRLESLRAWERRYHVVTPRRSEGNQRLYTREDVNRLQLIKQLVDRGHAVSSVASLSERALRERLQLHHATGSKAPTQERPVRTVIYGDVLPFLVESWRDTVHLEVLGNHSRFAEFENDAIRQKPEVLILELPSLNADVPGRLRQLRLQSGARAVVVYGFGPSGVLDRLHREGVVTLRAPVAARELELACLAETEAVSAPRLLPIEASAPTDDVPPRRFDGRQLAAVTTSPTGIRCECPRHLADLVLSIGAFESYSADCENRDEQDAALHAHLFRTAAKARALMEEALEYLMQYEGIDMAVSR